MTYIVSAAQLPVGLSMLALEISDTSFGAFSRRPHAAFKTDGTSSSAC